MELPLLDLPFNAAAGGYRAPSMSQSLQLTRGFYHLSHHALAQLLDPRSDKPAESIAAHFAFVGFDVLTTVLPLGLNWQHEEWHRAVMMRRDIRSHDGIYDLQLSAWISVRDVDDRDLIRLKADHPAEMVHTGSSGLAANAALADRLHRDAFFGTTSSWDNSTLWALAFSTVGYMGVCASPANTAGLDAYQADEDATDREYRDFTGLDCTAWAYDLHRPDDAYEERGTHPSGVGVDRYISHAELSDEERRWLRTNFLLSLVHFADPALVDVNTFGSDWRWFPRLRLIPTPSGSDFTMGALVAHDDVGFAVTLHNHLNGRAWFPGLEGEVMTPQLEARLGLWLQPEDLRFDTLTPTPGGVATVRYRHTVDDRLDLWIEGEAKSAGWLSGNVYLEPNVSVRTGLRLGLF